MSVFRSHLANSVSSILLPLLPPPSPCSLNIRSLTNHICQYFFAEHGVDWADFSLPLYGIICEGGSSPSIIRCTKWVLSAYHVISNKSYLLINSYIWCSLRYCKVIRIDNCGFIRYLKISKGYYRSTLIKDRSKCILIKSTVEIKTAVQYKCRYNMECSSPSSVLKSARRGVSNYHILRYLTITNHC